MCASPGQALRMQATLRPWQVGRVVGGADNPGTNPLALQLMQVLQMRGTCYRVQHPTKTQRTA